jgi:hypothetical protein
MRQVPTDARLAASPHRGDRTGRGERTGDRAGRFGRATAGGAVLRLQRHAARAAALCEFRRRGDTERTKARRFLVALFLFSRAGTA